jgi:hypothetical protein
VGSVCSFSTVPEPSASLKLIERLQGQVSAPHPTITSGMLIQYCGICVTLLLLSGLGEVDELHGD